MAGRPDRTRQLKGVLLVLGILVLGGILVMFSLHRHQSISDSSEPAAADNEATVALEGIHHTDIREGAKDWILDAESADYRFEKNQVFLSNLQASFFDNKGETVVLTAESGVWHTDSNDLEVSGDVVLKNSQCVMRTDRLIYTELDRLFATRSPVEIHGFSLNQVADGMTYSLDTGKMVFDGNVEGEFGNGIDF